MTTLSTCVSAVVAWQMRMTSILSFLLQWSFTWITDIDIFQESYQFISISLHSAFIEAGDFSLECKCDNEEVSRLPKPEGWLIPSLVSALPPLT